MSIPNGAVVLNQSEADFARSAERIQWEGPDSIASLNGFLQEQASGLNNYLARYKEDVVVPFNIDPESKKMIEGGNINKLAFMAGALMTFKMVDGVSKDTAVELPDLTQDNLQPANPYEISFVLDASKKVIDLLFRGPELRDGFPNVYRPSLKLMAEILTDPIDKLQTDLETPLARHRNPYHIAFPELHFIGGAAETVLAIEQCAVAQNALLN